jgi:hypothetical protein
MCKINAHGCFRGLGRTHQNTEKKFIKIHFHIIQLCTQPIYKTMNASKPLPAEGRKETP